MGKHAKNDSLAFDDAKIAALSSRIVAKALQPFALADYILNYLDDGQAGEGLPALRSAIDDRYADFKERYDKGERGDVEAQLNIIEELVKFHIGVAVGRLVKARSDQEEVTTRLDELDGLLARHIERTWKDG